MLEFNEPTRQVHHSICIDQLARIGDKVVCTFDKDPSSPYSWGGCNDIAHLDGLKGEIVDRAKRTDYIDRVGHSLSSGLKPGVYEAPGQFIVLFESGEHHHMSMHHVLWVEGYDKMNKERQDARPRLPNGELDFKTENYGQHKFLFDLPKLKWWHGDHVNMKASWRRSVEPDETFTICGINWHRLDDTTPEGWDVATRGLWEPSLYDVQSSRGYTTYCTESDIESCARGNVWKFYNDHPLHFHSLEEEIQFARLMQQCEQICCPQTGHYGWEGPENFLPGLRDGIIDLVTVGGLFGSKSVGCYRFNDRDLGRRVRAKTLEGFGITP